MSRGWRSIVVPLVAALAISSITIGNAAPLGSGDNDRWQMFAPNPPDEAVWTTMGGTPVSGAHLDAFPFRAANVTADRPPDLADTHPNVRWGRYFLTIGELDHRFRRTLADYACRRWNATHDDSPQVLSVTQHVERVVLDGENPVRRNTLIEYNCATGSGASRYALALFGPRLPQSEGAASPSSTVPLSSMSSRTRR